MRHKVSALVGPYYIHNNYALQMSLSVCDLNMSDRSYHPISSHPDGVVAC
jgi:hypothetical protein